MSLETTNSRKFEPLRLLTHLLGCLLFYSLAHSFTYLITHSITCSFTHSLSYSLIRSLALLLSRSFTHSIACHFSHSLTYPLTRSLIYSPIRSLAFLLTCSLTQSPIRSLACSLTHSISCYITHSLTYSFTHSLAHLRTYSLTRSLELLLTTVAYTLGLLPVTCHYYLLRLSLLPLTPVTSAHCALFTQLHCMQFVHIRFLITMCYCGFSRLRARRPNNPKSKILKQNWAQSARTESAHKQVN